MEVLNPEYFFDAVRQALQNDLPGEQAQFRMAPAGRRKSAPVDLSVPPRQAAVLIPVYPDSAGISSLALTLRKEYPGVHGGQISFPGGKFESGETDPVAVALRESAEEVGIREETVRIAGLLSPLYIPASHITVQPVLGLLQNEPQWILDPTEVERLVPMPLSYLFDPRRIQEKQIPVAKGISLTAPCYLVDGQLVWGATAMILSELTDVLRNL